MTCHVDGVYATTISSCSSFNQLREILRSAQQAEDMPGYLQEDIITLRNKGSVTVSRKSEEGACSDVRTQEGQNV